MSDLINPFTEVVVFGKAYPVAWPPPGAKVLRALVPTGGHVSHANKLDVTRNSKASGGPATRLERYTRGKVHKGSVAQGLRMTATPADKAALRSGMANYNSAGPLARRLRNKPVNSSLPTASKSGRRIG